MNSASLIATVLALLAGNPSTDDPPKTPTIRINPIQLAGEAPLALPDLKNLTPEKFIFHPSGEMDPNGNAISLTCDAALKDGQIYFPVERACSDPQKPPGSYPWGKINDVKLLLKDGNGRQVARTLELVEIEKIDTNLDKQLKKTTLTVDQTAQTAVLKSPALPKGVVIAMRLNKRWYSIGTTINEHELYLPTEAAKAVASDPKLQQAFQPSMYLAEFAWPRDPKSMDGKWIVAPAQAMDANAPPPPPGGIPPPEKCQGVPLDELHLALESELKKAEETQATAIAEYEKLIKSLNDTQHGSPNDKGLISELERATEKAKQARDDAGLRVEQSKKRLKTFLDQRQRIEHDLVPVCMQVDTTGLASLKQPPLTGLIVKPNTSIFVEIIHPQDWKVKASLSGTRAISLGAMAGEPKAEALSEGAHWTQTFFMFAPRAKGPIDLTVEATHVAPPAAQSTQGNGPTPDQVADGKTVTSPPVEFIVEETYSGTFRLGFATVFGAPDATYSARTFPGSGQAEIVAASSRQDLEVVAGYSFYLESFKGGRSYTGGTGLLDHLAQNCILNLGLGCGSPYIAFGFLSTAADNKFVFDGIKSVYAGLDIEMHPNFSVSLTGVYRRVTRLQYGLVPGSAIDAGAPVPTRTEGLLGFAIVLNISPEIFRLTTTSFTQAGTR